MKEVQIIVKKALFIKKGNISLHEKLRFVLL